MPAASRSHLTEVSKGSGPTRFAFGRESEPDRLVFPNQVHGEVGWDNVLPVAETRSACRWGVAPAYVAMPPPSEFCSGGSLIRGYWRRRLAASARPTPRLTPENAAAGPHSQLTEPLEPDGPWKTSTNPLAIVAGGRSALKRAAS